VTKGQPSFTRLINSHRQFLRNLVLFTEHNGSIYEKNSMKGAKGPEKEEGGGQKEIKPVTSPQKEDKPLKSDYPDRKKNYTQ